MSNFKIIPLSKQYASKIRKTGIDDAGYQIVEQIATGHGPCRVSLQPFEPGKDERILLSHSPFEIDNAFNQPGPIFIHKQEVEPYKNVHQFPAEIKGDKQNFPLSLIGYSDDQKMVFTKMVGDDDIDLMIPKIFQKHKEVLFMHARNSEAGCYICKIERS